MKKKIAVIGVGYVGLPLAISLSKYYEVIGYDINLERIKQLKSNNDINLQLKSSELFKSKIFFTNYSKYLSNCNVFIITVPTPVLKNKLPDLKILMDASKLVANNLKKGDLIIYESTVYPGLTDEITKNILEKISNLTVNNDFYLGYSPERINPGDKKNTLDKIVKIVSGSNNQALKMIYEIYIKICKGGVHKADSIKIAESAKIIENIQRDVNIALVNELYKIFDKLDINFEKILDAAKTKWNFLDFTPGLVGGHCIGVDPYYLLYLTKIKKINTSMISSGRQINDNMYLFVIYKIKKIIKELKLKKENLKILIIGLTYKKNCPDIRNSQVIRINNRLLKEYNVTVFDSIISKVDKNNFKNFNDNYYKDKFDIIFINHIHDNFKNRLKVKQILKQNGQVFNL